MEGLIFIGFLAFIALVFFKPSAGSKLDPNKKGLDKDGNYDIPEALRVKWNGEGGSSSTQKTPSKCRCTSICGKAVFAIAPF